MQVIGGRVPAVPPEARRPVGAAVAQAVFAVDDVAARAGQEQFSVRRAGFGPVAVNLYDSLSRT
jgi:hypothetical protein